MIANRILQKFEYDSLEPKTIFKPDLNSNQELNQMRIYVHQQLMNLKKPSLLFDLNLFQDRSQV